MNAPTYGSFNALHISVQSPLHHPVVTMTSTTICALPTTHVQMTIEMPATSESKDKVEGKHSKNNGSFPSEKFHRNNFFSITVEPTDPKTIYNLISSTAMVTSTKVGLCERQNVMVSKQQTADGSTASTLMEHQLIVQAQSLTPEDNEQSPTRPNRSGKQYT